MVRIKLNQLDWWVAFAAAIAPTVSSYGQSNVRDDAKFGWAENIGWLNWRDADGGSAGVVIGSTYLSGFIWAENAGWINVGDGSPTGGVHYANVDGTDFGVNIDPGTGQLFGLAWGENIGWINFDTASLGAQAARLDPCTKRFHGYAWGENIGWINLDDATHFVASELSFDCNSNALEDVCDPDFDSDDLIDDCDDDIDGDGVNNGPDTCDFTPDSAVVGGRVILDSASSLYGTIRGDYDGDCDCDLVDYADFSLDFTGAISSP